MYWYHHDINRVHMHFQSDALPTELWHQLALLSECKGRAFFVTDQTFLYFFIVKGEKSALHQLFEGKILLHSIGKTSHGCNQFTLLVGHFDVAVG